MNRNLLWRGLFFGVVLLAAVIFLYPPDDKIHLGLDLRGGIHLVLEVQAEDALRAETEKDLDTVVRQLEEEGIAGASAARTGDSTFEVRGVASEQQGQLEEIVDDFLPTWDMRRSGDVYVMTRQAADVADIRDQAVRQAEQTIRNRIDAFGVAEPVIQRQGGLQSDRIVVQLPGVDDPERVKRLIKNTAFLEFRFVDGSGNTGTREEVLSRYGGTLPEGVEIVAQDITNAEGEVIDTAYLPLETRQVVTGRDLKTARPGLGQFNEPVVLFYLSAEAGKTFAQETQANIGRQLAIVLDGKVQSAPVIEGRIADSGQIRGQFTQQQVEDLVTVLRSGALPAGITYLEERTVGPALGQDSIEKGLRAGLIGGALVMLTMLLVYKLSGINALVVLAANVILVFGALAYVGATLTLPGIAGIVLTIGMAVDANVLIYERIREELRAGHTVKSAISSGFSKAFSSILDANVTTLIAAIFLFQFGTGPIRGFAVTLSIGIVGTMFSAVLLSRWLFDALLSRRGRVERLSI